MLYYVYKKMNPILDEDILIGSARVQHFYIHRGVIFKCLGSVTHSDEPDIAGEGKHAQFVRVISVMSYDTYSDHGD